MHSKIYQADSLKPKNRNLIRLKLGKAYYTGKRYLWWIFGNHKFSKKQLKINLKYRANSHSTPLLRKLKDVDMILQYNKITNLKLAVKKLNNIVIYPGETFSFWKLIGKPTNKKGYLDGMVLFCGTFGAGVGGGLCQLSNLIYWITIHTELTVMERYRHSFDIFPDSNRTQPFGSGASCVYNYRDLIIKNETQYPYQLCLEVGEKELFGEWRVNFKPDYYYEIYQKTHRFNLEYWGGYTRHNEIFRKKFDLDDNEIADEFVVENHAIMMYSPLIENKSDEKQVEYVK